METMDTIEIVPEKLTKEELRILKELRDRPIVYDEDCPETTPERAKRFRRVKVPRRGVRS